tara:strand:+ start:509 stop:667 length:159 start_codon:yes stop_codon:yes gene_type:complete
VDPEDSFISEFGHVVLSMIRQYHNAIPQRLEMLNQSHQACIGPFQHGDDQWI